MEDNHKALNVPGHHRMAFNKTQYSSHQCDPNPGTQYQENNFVSDLKVSSLF